MCTSRVGAHDDISVKGLVKRGVERCHQLVGKALNEAHGVGNLHGLPVCQWCSSDAGVQRCKELVLPRNVLQNGTFRRCEKKYGSAGTIWQPLHIGKRPRIPNNLIISGAHKENLSLIHI